MIIKNKKAMTSLRTYFLIINIVLAIVAFSWMVNAAKGDDDPGSTPLLAGLFGKEGGGAFIEGAITAAVAYGIGYFIGGLVGQEGDNADDALGAAFAAGSIAKSIFPTIGLGGGIIVAAIVFAVMYKKVKTQKVEFTCLPWEAPIGGADCEKCNDFEECSEYRCKSLGQACELQNAGTEKEICTWVHRGDVNSPLISMGDVIKGHVWLPDTSIRPPATGVEIRPVENGPCIEAFTPLEFTIETDEPAKCRIDYNLTKGFKEMGFSVESELLKYNHTETLSLPGPDAINAIAPELKNDGTYTLYVRCQDANGNFNQDPYSVRFCVNPGPHTTPPRIDDLSIPSNSPIRFNQSTLDLKVYVNEPAECKWSREIKHYDLMENQMACETNLWDMKKLNNNWVYTCETTLTGIASRQDNDYYFRCKGNPGGVEGDRYENTQSSLYTIIGTQPLTLLDLKPDEGEIIKGSTADIPVVLEVKTDNGYMNGESTCSYAESETTPLSEDYIDFSKTGGRSIHTQTQNLRTGTYRYWIRCIDLGGNAIYEDINFEVESDNNEPLVIRAYKQAGQLRIITNEDTECAYSNKDCNFEIEEGIRMNTVNDRAHAVDWLTNKNYYIRCKDDFQNQPGLSEGEEGCSIIIRPYQLVVKENVIEL